MKKQFLSTIIGTIVLAFLLGTLQAQTVTLTFTGKDANNQYVQLNRVAITNLTKGWQETIYWPDTTLTMQNGTGIDESIANGGFALSQNNPNPFTVTTDVNLTVTDAGAVTLEIVDGNGKIVGTHRVRPEIGTHQFRVSLSTAGTYVMTARQNGKTSSIKMVCNGGGNTNAIKYLGMVQTITYVLKSTTNNPFNFGDMMEYVGYATINGTEAESQRITQAQGTSQTFILQFDAVQLYVPVVSTDTVSDVTTTSATCGGNVTNDGGDAVISRGVCFNTIGTPTVNDTQTTDGSGLGSFVSLLDGLTPHTEYFVRAYATNSVGTAYGEERSFTTLCDLPEVTTTQPSNISSTTFTCGGDVIDVNCDGLTARGVCWNTTGNPTVAENHTTDGTAAGSFTSSVTGLSCSTTYYVRAYATNIVGTVYGDEYEVTTLDPTIPDIATLSATFYNCLNMIVTSEVISENCEAISSRGICYSTSPNPTISASHTTHAIGLGTLNDTIAELNTGTTYYVRAYATNSLGTTYGEELSVTTPTLPTVTTTSFINIAATSATSGGNVTDDGGAPVTARGVCWSTSQNPTISGTHTIDGNGTGSFTSSITGLEDSTTYYVRAYVTNCVGTTYGEEVSFTTPTWPIVTTRDVTSITTTTATSGGIVTQNGGASVTARGVCWSTSHNPTISDSHATNGTGTGYFTSSITGLTASTTYYVRAYATNMMGTAYGEEVSFTTPLYEDGDPCPGTPTLTDIDGNTYSTVIIGGQCWMKENLRTKKYANGTSISQGSDTSTTTAYWYYPGNSSSNINTYGLLYNWKAVMHDAASSSTNPSGVQGICPTGWHVPSDAEWKQMEMAVGMSQSDADNVGYRGYIAARLCGNTGWNSSSNANAAGNTSATGRNSSGFSALPASYYNGYIGYNAYFWSATERSTRYLSYGYAGVYRSGYGSNCSGYSVRCVRDEDGALPTVTTTSVTNISATNTTSGGNVTSDGGAIITARGVCWSTSHYPTTDGSHTTNGTGTGSFTSNITGLIPGTTYYVRAYATNIEGTAYGNEVSFTTTTTSLDGQPCPGTPTLTDASGNTYNTVWIGTQCWMKENLRTKKYANGTNISQGSIASNTTPYWYYPNNSSSNMSTYGLLYNWTAVMRNSSASWANPSASSDANPSGVQGICPDGWHVPSDAEWKQLEMTVGMSQSDVDNTGSRGDIAARLCDNTGWTSSDTTNAAGNISAIGRNISGFSVLPAGHYSGSYYDFGNGASFWSATEGENHPYCRGLYYNRAGVSRGNPDNYRGLSVRCVRD